MQTQNRTTCMLRGEEKKNRHWNGSKEAAATLKAWWLIQCSSVSNIFLMFCIYVCFSGFSFLCVKEFRTAGLIGFFFYLLRFLFTLPLLCFSYLSLCCFFSTPFSLVFSSFISFSFHSNEQKLLMFSTFLLPASLVFFSSVFGCLFLLFSLCFLFFLCSFLLPSSSLL